MCANVDFWGQNNRNGKGFFFEPQSFIQTWLQGCCRLLGLPHTSGPLCSTQALFLVYIRLFFDGFFFIWLFMYIYISETLRSGFGSIICVCKSKLLIYDSLIRILAFGNGVCFFFSQVSYLFTKFWFCLLLRSMGSWFLEMGLVCFCHSYDIYLPSFIYLFIIIKLLLRSMGTWIWALIYQYIFCVCVCENCTFKFL